MSEEGSEGEQAAHAAALDAATNVSNSHLGQNTASSALAAEGGKWSCEVCTYENYPVSKKCTMCRTPKTLLGEDIFRLQEEATALPTRETCDVECVSERLRPLRISSPPQPPLAAPPHAPPPAPPAPADKWSCLTCTYENWPKSQKCAMCGSSPPPALQAPPPAPQAPPPASLATPTIPRAVGHTASISKPIASNDALSESSDDQRRKRRNNLDWAWLQACLGVVEGEARCVDAYLAGGGDPARALTPHEVSLLNRASAFDAGHTLVHLAIRFQRQEILSTLLSRISGGGPGVKRSPSYVAPDLAMAIRRHIAASMRQKKGSFPCRYIDDICTFSLPAEIEELPGPIQEQLFSELLDKDAQHTLETEQPIINWSLDVGCRLYALWNRSLGDCLLDATCQAAFGVSDRGCALRTALHDNLQRCSGLYSRWAAWERLSAAALQFAPSDAQLRRDYSAALLAAARPQAALTQIHVWVLSHIFRRPLLVYGVKVVTSFRGDPLDYARFHGLYLPQLWDPGACHKSPLVLGYTRGHFSALVPLDAAHGYICRDQSEEHEEINYLPLTDFEGKLLPVHFLTCDEVGSEEAIIRRYCTVTTVGGVLCAQQPLSPRPLLLQQLLHEWLNRYRQLAQQTGAGWGRAPDSSEADTDDE